MVLNRVAVCLVRGFYGVSLRQSGWGESACNDWTPNAPAIPCFLIYFLYGGWRGLRNFLGTFIPRKKDFALDSDSYWGTCFVRSFDSVYFGFSKASMYLR